MLQLKLLPGLLLRKNEPLKDVLVTIIGNKLTIGPAKRPVSQDFRRRQLTQNDQTPPRRARSDPKDDRV